MTFILDTPVALSNGGVVCKSGKVLPADMIVNASGCRFNANPDFLQHLNLGKLCSTNKGECVLSVVSIQLLV